MITLTINVDGLEISRNFDSSIIDWNEVVEDMLESIDEVQGAIAKDHNDDQMIN